MKFFVSVVTVALIASLPIVSMASAAGEAFYVSGSADFPWPASKAESIMRENAQTNCGADAFAKQITETTYQLAPRAYPTETVASAEFVCE